MAKNTSLSLNARQTASRVLASQKGEPGSKNYKTAYKSAMRSLQRQQAPEGKQQRGQKRGVSPKYKSVRDVAAREPHKARKGKYKAQKADLRFKKNIAGDVTGKKKLQQ